MPAVLYQTGLECSGRQAGCRYRAFGADQAAFAIEINDLPTPESVTHGEHPRPGAGLLPTRRQPKCGPSHVVPAEVYRH